MIGLCNETSFTFEEISTSSGNRNRDRQIIRPVLNHALRYRGCWDSEEDYILLTIYGNGDHFDHVTLGRGIWSKSFQRILRRF